jgi:nitrite reductase (NO-forming)
MGVVTVMGRWIWEKLQQWLILILGLAVISGSIGIGALFQSHPEPPKSIEVASVKQDDTPKPSPAPPIMAPKATTATSDAYQAAAAPASIKPVAEENTKTDGKESSDTKARATGTAAPAPQPAQTAAPMMHDHAPPPTTAAAAASQTALAGEAAAGRQVFRKCQACHSLDAGMNGLGPSLAGIIGEKAAAVPGYNFSPAMKASSLVWDAATLDAYLTDPQKVVPGNKMPFPGLKTERERSAVIALLAANSKSGAAPATAAPAPPTTAAQKAPASLAAAPSDTVPPTSSASAMPGPSYVPGLRYTLRSGIAEGRMVFIGVGGSIDGQVNPLLSAAEGQAVQVTLINGEGAEHDIVFDHHGPAEARRTSLEEARARALPSLSAGPATMPTSAACRGTGCPAWKGNSSLRPSRRQRPWFRPTSHRSQRTCRLRSAIGGRSRCGSTSSRSSSRHGSPRERRLATGPSAARCRARCCVSASATRSRFT